MAGEPFPADGHEDLIMYRVGGDRVGRGSWWIGLVRGRHAYVCLQSASINHAEQLRGGGCWSS